MHRGSVLYERYFGELAPERVHAVMSVTKSFTGTLASILVAESVLDENKLVNFLASRIHFPEKKITRRPKVIIIT
ncbi:serine hydrolase [Planobacterium sp. JC490]|nr:serine hydrolase [Chryseobacterium salipaludis]MCX3297679.1 serine hydrolase [Planobacterium sp. JC490]